MYEAPDLSSYSAGYGGVDAASAASIASGSIPDGGPGLSPGEQADAYLTGSDGGFPALLGNTPAGLVVKGATAVMSAIFGADSIGPMGAFPGDAVSVSQDVRPVVLGDLAPAGKIDAGPVQPSTGEGFLSDFLSGFLNGASGQAAPDPRVNMTAQDELLFFRAGQVPPASFAPSPSATAAGQVTTLPSAYGPLQLEVTPKARDWSGLILAAVAFMAFS